MGLNLSKEPTPEATSETDTVASPEPAVGKPATPEVSEVPVDSPPPAAEQYRTSGGTAPLPAPASSSQPPPPDNEDTPPDSFTLKPKTQNFRPLLYGLIGIVALGVMYKVGTTLYINTLLNTGIESIKQGDYQEGLGYIRKYIEFNAPSEESSLWLARGHMFSGNAKKVGEVLTPYTDSLNPEIRYLLAMSTFSEDPEAALYLLPVAEGNRQLPYLTAATGVLSLLNDNYRIAQSTLSENAEIMRNGEFDRLTQKHFRALYLFFLKLGDNRPEFNASQQAPLSFAALTEANEQFLQKLGFALDTSGFNNYYSIPFAFGILLPDLEKTSIDRHFEGLELLAQVKYAPKLALETVTSLKDKQGSVLKQYIVGYFQAINGMVEEAADTYKRINEQSPSSFSYSYEAATRWQTQNGALPSDAVMKAYGDSLAANENDVVTLNNYIYLNLYLQNIDRAGSIAKHASRIGNLDPHLNMNVAIVELANNTISLADSIPKIYAILEAFPNSVMALNLAVRLETLNGNFLAAAEHAQKIQTLLPDDPSVVLLITNLYRTLYGEQLLSISTLEKGLKRFPNNAELLHALIVSHARNKNEEAVTRLSGGAGLSPNNNLAALHANALLAASDHKKSAALFKQALNLAPASYKTGLALDMARAYIETRKIAEATSAHGIAASHAENSTIVDVDFVVSALGERIHIASGLSSNPENALTLLAKVESRQIFAAQLDLCWGLIKLGAYEPVIKNLEALRQKQVGSINLLEALSVVYEKSNLTKKAEDIRKHIGLVRAGAKDADAETLLKSNTQRVFGNHTKILAAIDVAIKKENFGLAISLYTDIIESKETEFTKPALSFQNRGALYLAVRKYKAASQDFSQALSIGGLTLDEEESIRYNYAYSLVQTKQFEEVEKQIEKLLPGKPPRDRTYLRLKAVAQMRQNNFAGGKATYETLIEKYPQDIASYTDLAKAANSFGEYELSIEVLTEALEIAPRNASLHQLLVEVYTRLEDLKQANRHKAILKDLQNQ